MEFTIRMFEIIAKILKRK